MYARNDNCAPFNKEGNWPLCHQSYVAVFDQVNHLIYALKAWHDKS